MKASQLVKYLDNAIKRFGDDVVFLQTYKDGQITEQGVFDVLSGNGIILVSEESIKSPNMLNDLPIHDVQ